MAAIDEILEIIRRAESAGGREHAGRLITPRAQEGVFHDRQQLNVGVAHLLYIRQQLVNQFTVAQMTPIGMAHP